MLDEFEGLTTGLTSPASSCELIAPNDGADLTFATRALYVGQSGDVAVRFLNGEIVTLVNMQAGVIYPIRIAQVLATGTTAGNLIGLR